MSNQWYNPAKIHGNFHADGHNIMRTSTPEGTVAVEPKLLNKVIVSESGEAVLVPDIAAVSICYKSIKETVEAVKYSVQRRIDYILQTLRNNGIKEFTIHKLLQRIDDQYQMLLEINVEFHDIKLCEDVCNFLVEKMDEQVIISKPTFSHAQGKLDTIRRQACLNAVKNARLKAEAIAQFVNQRLGSTIEVKEENISEVTGTASTNGGTQEVGIKARREAAIVTVSVKISATFEIEPKSKKKVH